jgi:hypothetical protein
MRHWFLALDYYWLNHRADIVGMALCTAFASGFFGVLFLIDRPNARPGPSVPTEGIIVGFVGGDSRYYAGVSVYIRSRDNRYGFVGLTLDSGCHTGDRIAVDEWEVNGHVQFQIRPPGCSHKF